MFVLLFVLPVMVAIVMMLAAFLDIHDFTRWLLFAGSRNRRTCRAADAGADHRAIAPADRRAHRRACCATQGPANDGITVDRRCRH